MEQKINEENTEYNLVFCIDPRKEENIEIILCFVSTLEFAIQSIPRSVFRNPLHQNKIRFFFLIRLNFDFGFFINTHSNTSPGFFFNPFPNRPCFITCLQYMSFENTVGKGEIAHNERFLLFPQYFLTI